MSTHETCRMVLTSAKLGVVVVSVAPEVSLLTALVFAVEDVGEVLLSLGDVAVVSDVGMMEVLAAVVVLLPLEPLEVIVDAALEAELDAELDVGETAGLSSSGPEQLHTKRQRNEPWTRCEAKRYMCL